MINNDTYLVHCTFNIYNYIFTLLNTIKKIYIYKYIFIFNNFIVIVGHYLFVLRHPKIILAEVDVVACFFTLLTD